MAPKTACTVLLTLFSTISLRYILAAPFPKRCAEIAVLVDETFSMRQADQSALLLAAEKISQGVQTEPLDYYPFVCVFGFGAFDTPSSKLLGCSLGFDASTNSIELDRSGSVEDGWEAIVSAINYFSMTPLEIDGISRETDCIDVQKTVIFITDEGRDAVDSSLSFSEVLAALVDNGWSINAILPQNLFPLEALGATVSSDGTPSFEYFVPASEDATSYDSVSTTEAVFGNTAFGSTREDYVELIKQAGGGTIMNILTMRRDVSVTDLLVDAFVDAILMKFQSSEPPELREETLSICSQAVPVSVLDRGGTVFIQGIDGFGSLEINPLGLLFCAKEEVNGVLPSYEVDFANVSIITVDLALELANLVLSLIQEAVIQLGSSLPGVDCSVQPFRTAPCDLGCSTVFESCAERSCSALAAVRALCEPFLFDSDTEVTIDLGNLGAAICSPSLLFVDGRCGRCNIVTASCIANGCSGVEDIATTEVCFDSKCNEFYECPGNCTLGNSDSDLLTDASCCGCDVPGDSCGSSFTCGNGFCDFSETTETCFVDCSLSTGCGLGELLCSDTCVDVSNDPSNCGNCGTRCLSDNLCVLGKCSVPSPFGIDWTTTVSGGGEWLISNGGQTIRFDIDDSINCGGPNGMVQVSTANATITLPEPLDLSLEITGVAELENTGFENMDVFLDNTLVVSATSTELGLGCEMGPAIFTVVIPPPYPLSVGNHAFFISFTTGDELYHVDAFYELNLIFTEPVASIP